MVRLCNQLLHANSPKSKEKDCLLDLPLPALTHHHFMVRVKSRGRCEWGKRHPPGCQRKQAPGKRAFNMDITANSNNSVKNTILYGSITRNRCSEC
jgi:hypothetical protein